VADSNLIIKISGDIESFDDALKQAQKRTEALEGKLASVAKASAVAFAALTAEGFLAVKAFGEAEEVTNRLTQAMQNQGIYSDDLAKEYNRIGTALQKLTGIDDDNIKSAIAVTQSMIGQTQVTEDLVRAIADMSAFKKMDLETTAELISKGINGQTAALKKAGIEVDEFASKEERMRQIIEQVTQKMGGQAAAANQGIGGIRGLSSAFGNLQEAIGERLAPALSAVIKSMTSFLTSAGESKALVDFGVSVGLAVSVVTGLGVVLGTGTVAWIKFKNAMNAARIATNAQGLAMKSLIGATGIGLLVILASELYLNWSTVWPRMQAIFGAFADNISALARGVGNVLAGMITFDQARIQSGMEEVKATLSKGWQEATREIKPIEPPPINQDKALKDAADRAARISADAQTRKLAALKAENELIALETSNGSAALINLKKQEIELLQKLEDEKYVKQRETILAKLEENRVLQAEQALIDQEQRDLFNQLEFQKTAEFQAMSEEQRKTFFLKNQKELQAQLLTEKTAREKAAKEKVQAEIDENNKLQLERAKHGKAIADLDSFFHSKNMQATSQALGNVASLTRTKNKELFEIGRAAGVAQAIINTAQGITEALKLGPFIGPALAASIGIAGAVQIATIRSATPGFAEGGVVTGGIPGVDSVPILAQQGEIVSPARNFDEVIGSVRAQREAEKLMARGQTPVNQQPSGVIGEIIISARDNFSEMFEMQLVERQSIGISLIPRGAI
jgi:hypothetical protein